MSAQHLPKARWAIIASFIALNFLAAPVSTQAQAPNSTLQRIAETGVIRIGYGETLPFSAKTADGAVIGYSIELCQRVASAIQTRLHLQKLDIAYVPRTAANRIQLIKDGSVDIECVASTNNAERRKSVAFSYPHFYVSTRYVTLTSSKIEIPRDLAGRTMSATLGTVNIAQINQLNRDLKLNLSIIPVENLKLAFAMVTDGRAAAFAMDDILLVSLIANAANPADYRLSNDAISAPEPYGFMMRLNDQPFVDMVNTALKAIYRSPEIDQIYDRWFNTPFPPNGTNLRLPMSETLRQAFANPVEIKD